jgi:hypothetical protein
VTNVTPFAVLFLVLFIAWMVAPHLPIGEDDEEE